MESDGLNENERILSRADNLKLILFCMKLYEYEKKKKGTKFRRNPFIKQE